MILHIFKATTSELKPILLAFGERGDKNVTLPAGPSSDSHRVYINIQIYDDSGAFTVYNLSTPIIVTTDPGVVNSTQSDLLSPTSAVFASISSSDVQTALNSIMILSIMFNMHDRENLVENSSNLTSNNEKRAQINDLFVNYISNITMTSLNEAQMVGATLAVLSNNPKQLSSNSAVSIFWVNKNSG
jgi:hypothetical protein